MLNAVSHTLLALEPVCDREVSELQEGHAT
jgi:hypothetical protein